MAVLTARNPRTGTPDFTFTVATSEDVDAAAARARAVQPAWSAKTLAERCQILNALGDAIAARRETIIDALVQDTGRLYLSEREVDGAVANIRRWATLALDVLPPQMETKLQTSKLIDTVEYQNQFVPYGVCGFISPWNFPVTLSLIDAVPALAAGACAIIKPSEVTSRFAAPLLAAIADVPALKDVVQIVLGDGRTGSALVQAVDLICFTGSVASGRKVAEAAARAFIPAFLELGGKDPLVVTATADVDRATDAALRGSILNSGQVCLSIERIYVAADIHDAFVEALVTKANDIELNWPDIREGHMGPLIFGRQADIIAGHLGDALDKGARIHCGGEIETHGGGRWLRPTVLTGVNHDMRIMREESFGPILPVMAFEDTKHAIALANDTSFGLSAAVFAGTIPEAKAIAAHINAGGLSLNDCGLTYMTYEPEKTSFGFSGLGGSRMGPASIQRFLRKKAFIANHAAPKPMQAFGERQATVTPGSIGRGDAVAAE